MKQIPYVMCVHQSVECFKTKQTFLKETIFCNIKTVMKTFCLSLAGLFYLDWISSWISHVQPPSWSCGIIPQNFPFFLHTHISCCYTTGEGTSETHGECYQRSHRLGNFGLIQLWTTTILVFHKFLMCLLHRHLKIASVLASCLFPSLVISSGSHIYLICSIHFCFMLETYVSEIQMKANLSTKVKNALEKGQINACKDV